jgi:uncharacterized protein
MNSKPLPSAVTPVRSALMPASVPALVPLFVRRAAATFVCAASAVSVALLAATPAHAEQASDSIVKAVKFDYDTAVGKEIAKGQDPNATDDQGMPLLVLAAREQSNKVAALLLDNPQTKVGAEDSAGENALMLAALNGDVDLVKLLITKGAEVNKQGWTALHYAAANGHDDIATLLLGYSADVNAPSPNGTTPLMMAARGDHLSTLKLLIAKGADINAKNQIGMTALDFAKQYKAPDAIKDLTARMAQEGNAAAPQSGAK